MRYLLKWAPILGHRALLRSEIREKTKISNDHMTPEIKLHLITPSCPLWYSSSELCVFSDPFWAFYWAGGQALSRYILDNKTCFKGKSVIDIGSGSGACAIAVAHCEDVTVIANDTDPVACEVIAMNSKLNGVKIHLNNSNLLNSGVPCDVDVILVGDMFYDNEFGNLLFQWLLKCRDKGVRIFIGDPGRHGLDGFKRKELSILETYSLMGHTLLENNGFHTAFVWQL